MNLFRILWLYIKLGVLNDLQYRSNFFLQVFQSLIEVGTGLVGLQIVFNYTDNLAGWSQNELLSLLGVYMFMGGLIQVFIQPNMDRLIGDIHRGSLDFTLIKPVDCQLLISIQEFRLWQGVDVITGVVVIVVAVIRMKGFIGLEHIFLFLLTTAMGFIMLYSVWLILATSAFWYIKTWDLLGIFTSLYQTSRWPVTIYPGWLRGCLTFIIPVAFAVSVPSMTLSGHLTASTFLETTIFAIVSFLLARWFWKFGLRSYSGASS